MDGPHIVCHIHRFHRRIQKFQHYKLVVYQCTFLHHLRPRVLSFRKLYNYNLIQLSLQKPVVALLQLPPSKASDSTTLSTPKLALPPTFKPTPDPLANVKRYTGRTIDRVVGIVWYLLTLLGAGSGVVGVFNFIIGIGAWTWWRGNSASGGLTDV